MLTKKNEFGDSDLYLGTGLESCKLPCYKIILSNFHPLYRTELSPISSLSVAKERRQKIY